MLKVKRKRPSIKEQAKMRKENESYMHKVRTENLNKEKEYLDKKEKEELIKKKHKKCEACGIEFCSLKSAAQKYCSIKCSRQRQKLPHDNDPFRVLDRNSLNKEVVLDTNEFIALFDDCE